MQRLPSRTSRRVAEGESDLKLKALRSDRRGEFTTMGFTDYCATEGVHHQHMMPYSPQQNGVVERWNGTVVPTAGSMLKAIGLPRWFWGEAVNIVVYVLNRCPTKSVEVKWSTSGIAFSQGAYVMKILERSGMTRCNSCYVPMEAHLKLSKQSMPSLVDATVTSRP
jgi:hypothetical protein